MNWISVADAALMVNRSERTIYNWIRQGLIRYRIGDTGATEVDGRHLFEVEPTVKRGRPPGSADRQPRRAS